MSSVWRSAVRGPLEPLITTAIGISGVYYRSGLDFEPLTAFGDVHPPGAWGRIMNGGAWLRHRDVRVDVVFRDIDVVDYWTARAADGDYEVDGLLGYLAGVPTYTLAAELEDVPSVVELR